MVAIIRHLRTPDARNEAPYRPPVLPTMVVRMKVAPEPKPEKLSVGPFTVRQTEYVGWERTKILRPLDQIASIVCEVFRVERNDLFSVRRNRRVSYPRQAAFLLAREFTTKSYPEIGRFFGDRDHTTVMHGDRRARERVDPDFVEKLERARMTLRNTFA